MHSTVLKIECSTRVNGYLTGQGHKFQKLHRRVSPIIKHLDITIMPKKERDMKNLSQYTDALIQRPLPKATIPDN